MNEDPRFKDPLYMAGFIDGATDALIRAIKLLEPYKGCQDETCAYTCECLRSDFFIALLKGETE